MRLSASDLHLLGYRFIQYLHEKCCIDIKKILFRKTYILIFSNII